MSNMSAEEQLMLELINRARMDPVGEAKRLGIKLNEGVEKGDRISADSKEVLAGNDNLSFAAESHSLWMLKNDVFSHNEKPGTDNFTGKTPKARVDDAGYDTTNGFMVGENIAFTGSTGKINPASAIVSQYRDLFLDKGVDGRGHRVNILLDGFREIGIGQELGKFESQGTNFNASMVTQDFGRSGTDIFLTGVFYNDLDGNDFFSVGEQLEGRKVEPTVGSENDFSGKGGGYELAFSENAGAKFIDFELDVGVMRVGLTIADSNIKIDIVNNDEVWTNTSITGVSSNVEEIHALGIDDIDLAGSSLGETFYGNSGQNTFKGAGGNDTFVFEKGDTARTAAGADVITDFASGDIIDLHTMDANAKKSGNQDFNFIDTADFHGKAAELRYVNTGGGDTLVQGDTNGDGKADFVIRITGTIVLTDAQFDL